MFYNPQDTPVLDDLIAFSIGMRWEMPISGPLQNTSNAEIIRSYSLRLTLELQGSHLFIQRKLRIDFHLCHYHWGIGQMSIPSLGTLFHYTQTHMHSHTQFKFCSMYRYSYTYGLNSIKYIYLYTHTYKYGLKSIHYTYTHKYIYD